MYKILIILAFFCISVNSNAASDCLSDVQMNGINLAGAEFNPKVIPGMHWKNYVFPTTKQLEYYRSKGVKSIRLPITWNRMQQNAYGELENKYLAEVKKVAQFAETNKICLIIDLHNFGSFKGISLASYGNYELIFYNFWSKMAQEFKSDSVAFGLMNEPAHLDRSVWRDLAQNTVNRLRADRIKNVLLVSGGNWSGAHNWFSGSPSNALLFANFDDPIDKMFIEVHQYADTYYSGTQSDCIDSVKMVKILQGISTWAQTNKQRLWLGEFGFSTSPECMNTMSATLDFMAGDTTWAGWSYWAGGAWWGNYPFSIEPINGVEKLQMLRLQKSF